MPWACSGWPWRCLLDAWHKECKKDQWEESQDKKIKTSWGSWTLNATGNSPWCLATANCAVQWLLLPSNFYPLLFTIIFSGFFLLCKVTFWKNRMLLPFLKGKTLYFSPYTASFTAWTIYVFIHSKIFLKINLTCLIIPKAACNFLPYKHINLLKQSLNNTVESGIAPQTLQLFLGHNSLF